MVLHVDHVHPRADGGGDDLLNLVTACVACNLGKGARQLSDLSVVERQRQQLDELQERKEQLEMMLDWQRGLLDLDSQQEQAAADFWSELLNREYSLTDNGRDKLRFFVKECRKGPLPRGWSRSLKSQSRVESARRRASPRVKAWVSRDDVATTPRRAASRVRRASQHRDSDAGAVTRRKGPVLYDKLRGLLPRRDGDACVPVLMWRAPGCFTG